MLVFKPHRGYLAPQDVDGDKQAGRSGFSDRGKVKAPGRNPLNITPESLPEKILSRRSRLTHETGDESR